MKKNATFIMMDSALAKSLYDALRTLQPLSKHADELLQGLEDLMEGEVATLMLGMAFMPVPLKYIQRAAKCCMVGLMSI